MVFRNRKNISKDIKKIRKKYDIHNLNSIIDEIQKYYIKNNFDNKLLLERIKQIQTDGSSLEILHGASVGALVGSIFSFAEIVSKIIDELSEILNSLIKIGIFFMFFIIVVIIIASLVTQILKILNWVYRILSKKNALNSYLDEKEIEIIKNILDENIRLNRKRKSRKYR